MEVLQHVLKTVLGIRDDDQIDSFSDWVSYSGYYSFNGICEHLHISGDTENYAEYRVNGIKYHLNSNTMHKIKMFTNWMSERMNDGIYIQHDEFLTSLTREQFIDFRHEDIKLMSNSRSSHTEPHTPMRTFNRKWMKIHFQCSFLLL